VRIVRRFATLSRRSSIFSRLAENVSFGVGSALELARMPRPDLVYLNTWPLFATALCALAVRFRRVPFVVSVQDVYPESLVIQERISERGWTAALLRRLDRSIARAASAVIVLTEQWAALYRRSRDVAPERVTVIPNWIDEQLVTAPAGEGLAWRRAKGVGDGAFLLVYGGNVGAAAGVAELIESFAVSGVDDAALLVAGEGSSLADCREIAGRTPRAQVLFHHPWRSDETAAVLGAADLLVLPTRGRQSAVSVPSKLISYLLAGRPLLAIATGDSETAAIVRNSGAGWIVRPGDQESFDTAVREARALSPEARAAMGEAGRRYALEHFSRRVILPRVLAVLGGAA
jgi:glycosyltransferase involved in cell wall biosynthesis